MPFQKGNKLGGGKKGVSGRKSAYQEQADAKLLFEMFFGKLTKKQIEKLTAAGKHSLKDKFIELAFDGNERILVEVFKKLFPDKYEGELKKPVNIIVTRTDDIIRGGGEEDGPVSESNDPVAQTSAEGVEEVPV